MAVASGKYPSQQWGENIISKNKGEKKGNIYWPFIRINYGFFYYYYYIIITAKHVYVRTHAARRKRCGNWSNVKEQASWADKALSKRQPWTGEKNTRSTPNLYGPGMYFCWVSGGLFFIFSGGVSVVNLTVESLPLCATKMQHGWKYLIWKM